MKRRFAILLAVAGLWLPGAALAQSSAGAGAGGIAQQFTHGANVVGQGAVQIGHGIRNGAILTWEAIKRGAHSFADTISGKNAASGENGQGR